MGVRPSEIWGVSWPLAAFYFDRGVRNWANFVDRLVNEAEVRVRSQIRSRRANVDAFALQAKQVTFNKLMGISVESLYSAPAIASTGKKSDGPKEKIDLDRIPGIPRIYR